MIINIDVNWVAIVLNCPQSALQPSPTELSVVNRSPDRFRTTKMSFKSYPMSVILHLLSSVTYGYSIAYIHSHDTLMPRSKGFGGHFKFLTHWDLWIQFFTFVLALICDFISNPHNHRGRPKPLAVKVRDLIFNGLALPMGCFVTISFWAIYSIDRELIFPVGVEKWYPTWLNHTTHSIILPIVLLENYLVDHNRRAQTKTLTLLLTVTLTYGIWVLYLGLAHNYWVYPVLEVLSMPFRLLFILGSLVLFFVLHIIGNILYDMAWKPAKIRSR